MLLLIINPGSTSTKIAVYEAERELLSVNICHSAEELAPFQQDRRAEGFSQGHRPQDARGESHRAVGPGRGRRPGRASQPHPERRLRGQRPDARGPHPRGPGRARLEPGRPDRRRDRASPGHPRLHRRPRRRGRARRLGPPHRHPGDPAPQHLSRPEPQVSRPAWPPTSSAGATNRRTSSSAISEAASRSASTRRAAWWTSTTA